MFREKYVEDNGDGGDGDDKEGAVPPLEGVGGGVEEDEALDLGGAEVGAAGYAGLPGEGGEPA